MRQVSYVFILVLAGCAQFPEIDAANRSAPPAGSPPPLLPINELLALTSEGPLPEAETDDLEARAAALRTRAAILRGQVNNADDLDALRARLAARS
ncbi:MAG: hypothetical protein AAGO57_01000 [Pseudomonadota bacterium]